MYLFNKENIWSNPQQFPASCIHSNNNSVNRIISKEEERRSKERFFNLSSSTVVFPHSYKNYKIPSNTVYSTVFLHAIQQLQVILHTELILLQEILQLQGSSRSGSFQQLFPVSPSILHGRIQHSKRSIHKQASSNSTRQKQHSTRQPASTQSLQ